MTNAYTITAAKAARDDRLWQDVAAGRAVVTWQSPDEPEALTAVTVSIMEATLLLVKPVARYAPLDTLLTVTRLDTPDLRAAAEAMRPFVAFLKAREGMPADDHRRDDDAIIGFNAADITLGDFKRLAAWLDRYDESEGNDD